MTSTHRQVQIERLTLGYAEQLAVVQADNHQELRRVNPMPYDRVSSEDLRARLQQIVLEERVDRAVFVILLSGRVVGDISLNHIIRYPMDCASVGIFVDRALQGQGVGTEAIARICEHAFKRLDLHRLEAGIQPFNAASLRAFEKNGFERIGLAQQLLLIDGAWRDHILLQKLAS